MYFKSAIPVGTKAPEITQAGIDMGDGTILPPPFDYKYAPYKDDVTTARTSVVYCYYGSASNQNIFNGANAPFLAFIIKYEGQASSVCGGVTPPPVILPVSFKSFNVTKGSTSNAIKWTTATEINNKGFYVQRFYNGAWENVAFVATKAEGGNSSSELNYTFNDIFKFSGIVQYRILQVDIDGKSSFSQIRSLSATIAGGSALVYPNPASANGVVSIVLANAALNYDIQILDNSGRILKEFFNVRNTQQVSNLPRGQYLARVKERETSQISIEKFIMQ